MSRTCAQQAGDRPNAAVGRGSRDAAATVNGCGAAHGKRTVMGAAVHLKVTGSASEALEDFPDLAAARHKRARHRSRLGRCHDRGSAAAPERAVQCESQQGCWQRDLQHSCAAGERGRRRWGVSGRVGLRRALACAAWQRGVAQGVRRAALQPNKARTHLNDSQASFGLPCCTNQSERCSGWVLGGGCPLPPLPLPWSAAARAAQRWRRLRCGAGHAGHGCHCLDALHLLEQPAAASVGFSPSAGMV